MSPPSLTLVYRQSAKISIFGTFIHKVRARGNLKEIQNVIRARLHNGDKRYSIPLNIKNFDHVSVIVRVPVELMLVGKTKKNDQKIQRRS